MCLNPKLAWYEYRTIINKNKKLVWTKILHFEKKKDINPDGKNVVSLPCGKCEQCKAAHAMEWGIRANEEAKQWKNNCFLTLTYATKNLPKKRSLREKDLTDFWKRLRKHETGFEEWTYKNKKETPIRYLACGEYGSKTKRPHYHAIVFNWKPNDLRYHKTTKLGDRLYTSKKLENIWQKGYCIIGKVTADSAAYVARYTTKKLTEKETIRKGREKEFLRMSRKLAIGWTMWSDETRRQEIIKDEGIWIKRKNKEAKLKPIPNYFKKKWREYDEMEYYETMEKIKEEKQKPTLNYYDRIKNNRLKWAEARNAFKRDKI